MMPTSVDERYYGIHGILFLPCRGLLLGPSVVGGVGASGIYSSADDIDC